VTGQPCSRGCLHHQRHLEKPCPVPDHQSGVFQALEIPGMIPGDMRDMFFDADTHALAPHWRQGVYVTRYGRLDTWHHCPGCKPRDATHGTVCDQCHLRLTGWLTGSRSIAWAYDWVAADLEPRQTAAGKITGSKAPPAAMALAIYDLRQEIAATLGSWLGMVCGAFALNGPEWWRRRITEAEKRAQRPPKPPGVSSIDWAEQHPRLNDWRAWLPQNEVEIGGACKYLATWLDRIEEVPDLVASIYDTAHTLMGRIAKIAPWQAKARNLPGIPCPSCNREALAIFEGSDEVECRRCNEIIPQERYDIWSVIAEGEAS
jgi:hypothetical protein